MDLEKNHFLVSSGLLTIPTLQNLQTQIWGTPLKVGQLKSAQNN